MNKTLLILLSAAVCLACSPKVENANATNTTTPPAASAAKSNLPSDHPPIGSASGVMPASTASAPAAASNAKLLTGTVAETMNSGGYTYVKVKTASGDVWAAVQATQTKVGAPITIAAQMTLDNFKSETLNKTFDHIVFGTIADPNAPAAPAAAAGQSPHGMTAPVPQSVGDVNVAKATGADAKTVAEVWGAGASLKDKPVTIHGKVVKFLPEIMGKNWLHLRDGSGSDAKKDNDITVVTKDVVAVGDVVTVKGTVRVDKDFGAGYKYPVIVEDAKVTK